MDGCGFTCGDRKDPLMPPFEEEVIFISQLTWVNKQKLAV